MGPRVSFFRLAQSSQPTQVLVRNKRHLVRRKKVREYDGDYTKKLGWVAPRGGGRKKGVKETKELLSLLSPVWHKKVTGNFSSYPLFFSPFLPGKEINISFLPFLWSFVFFSHGDFWWVGSLPRSIWKCSAFSLLFFVLVDMRVANCRPRSIHASHHRIEI